jgi:uncharacterized protein (TIGR02453 family)
MSANSAGSFGRPVRAASQSGGPLDVAAAFTFLRGLKKNNDRTWFEANRERFDTIVKPGFEDFVAGLLIAAARFDERFASVEPKRCIFRIYRDVRFAKDKSPYKTAVSAFLSPRGWRGTTPGFYVALEPGGESLMAAGIYTPEKPVLADLRRRIADGDPAFDRLLRAKRFAPYLPLDTDPLARLPAGFDPAHPRADLLRARRFMVRRPFSDAELLRGEAFTLYRDAMRDTAPLVRWLDASLADGGPLPAGFDE